jgi:hypothetical protein
MNQETTTSLIDAALASGSASALDPEERRLQEFMLAIRDDAPTPDPDFALRMNARVAAGFPPRRAAGFGGRVRALFATRPQLAAMGAAASLLIAVIVVAAGGSGGTGSNGSTSPPVVAAPLKAPNSTAAGSVGSGAQRQAAPSLESDQAASGSTAAAAPAAKAAPAIGGGTAVVPPVQPGGTVGGRNRKVERSASLVLAPTKDKLNEVGDQVIAVTDRYRGFVMQSSITSAAGSGSGGSFDLRIPSRNLQPALRDLSALADVKSRTENADDVTASFVNARTRLQELTAERRGLLRRLASAPTDQAAAAIRARIRIVNGEIQAQNNQLADLRRRTSYSTVSVTLEPKAHKSGGGGAGGGISKGARDLRDSLVASANITLRVLGVALPIAILMGLFWAANGWFTRRRREAALERQV